VKNKIPTMGEQMVKLGGREKREEKPKKKKTKKKKQENVK
jgi:hypothetical protein